MTLKEATVWSGVALLALGCVGGFAHTQAVWSGPRVAVEWQGLSPIAADVSVAKNKEVVENKSPTGWAWVGYFFKQGVCHVRLKNGATARTVTQGETTPEGWQVAHIDFEKGKPARVLLAKDDTKLPLHLQR